MSATLNKATVFTALIALVAILANGTVTFAQRDAGAKARGEVGAGFWGSQSGRSSARSYAPSFSTDARRSYSYSPADKGEKAAPAVKDAGRSGCHSAAKNKAADDSVAKAPQKSRRSYSYEPSMRSGSGSRAKAKKDPWLYPKADPRRYSGGR